MFIFRNGVPFAVPEGYQRTPQHRALVEALSTTNSYADAVAILASVPVDHWLAADVLTGAPWACRYLNSTALAWAKNDPLATKGQRALMAVLSGTRPKAGRHRNAPLSHAQLAQATATLAAWRVLVDAAWAPDPDDRADTAIALSKALVTRKAHSPARQKTMVALLRRPRLRKADLVRTLASWEMGFPLRRALAKRVADLVYG